MRPTALILAALLLTPAAFADVMPPPEEITDVQKQIVGVWQQDALGGLGHGEGLETMFFVKDRCTIVSFTAMTSENIYGLGEFGGAYTAERISENEIRVTVQLGSPSPGYTPPTQELDFKFDGPDHITIHKQGRMAAEIGYTRITPKSAP